MSRLPCPAALWPAFSALLDEALALQESQVPAWLASLGPQHAAVKPYLAQVLANTSSMLEDRYLRARVQADSLAEEFSAGQRIGPYILERQLGQGGMGEVWLAFRADRTPDRHVALKLPHSSLLAGVPRRRFERERDILAALSHPHIAQLYDAGVADSQHPYLAMEWVDGVSIVEHCRHLQLSLEQRLQLFLQVLEAVGYAHGRLIAHRDLKPNNILVTRDGQVKLLDFGIAKLLAGDTTPDLTQLTQVGRCMATPGYAAPEQLAGEPITAAVDLYSLGIVLYELLSGRRPFADSRRATIEHATLPRPSSQIDPDHANTVGGLTSRQLRRALLGDLDAITVKALQSEPKQRYGSAESFARDIRLSRDHRPISARHISLASLAVMFARRNWLGVTLAACLALALVGGSAGIAWQAVRTEREARRATTIKDFLVDVFRASDPRIAADKPRGEITARELLDISAGRIETSFAQTPATQLELLGVTADIYRELDETRRSTALYVRETEIARKYYGDADPHTIEGLLGQAFNANVDGDPARALQLLTRADPLLQRAGQDRSAARARWWLIRGEALIASAGNVDSAKVSYETAASLFGAEAPRDPLYPISLTDLGTLTLERSEFGASAAYYRRAMVIAKANPQSEGDLLLINTGLALALKNSGDFSGAAAAFEDGTNLAAHTYGRDNPNYWAIASDWDAFRHARGDRTGALAAFEGLLREIPTDRTAFRNGSGVLEASQVLRKYGRCLANEGQGTRAVEILEQARSLLVTTAARIPDAAHLQLDLGLAYDADGRVDAARESFLNAIDALKKRHAPDAQFAVARASWGQFLFKHGDADQAQAQFDEVLRLSGGHRTEPAIIARTGLAAIATGKGNAVGALKSSRLALSQLSQVEGYYDARLEPYVWGVHARALLLGGDLANAREFASRARDATLAYYSPASAQVREADALLEQLASRPNQN